MYKIRQFIYAWPYQAIRNNIVAKKTTELVLLFHKKTTKLVFLWPNMSQKCFKVLTTDIFSDEFGRIPEYFGSHSPDLMCGVYLDTILEMPGTMDVLIDDDVDAGYNSNTSLLVVSNIGLNILTP